MAASVTDVLLASTLPDSWKLTEYVVVPSVRSPAMNATPLIHVITCASFVK